MSISSIVLELWQFSFIRNWPEIRKSEIALSEFCPISGDWKELGIPNLAQMSLLQCSRMPRLQLSPFLGYFGKTNRNSRPRLRLTLVYRFWKCSKFNLKSYQNFQKIPFQYLIILSLSRRRPLLYRNQSIDLLRKLMDWSLYDNGLGLERVNNKWRFKPLDTICKT